MKLTINIKEEKALFFLELLKSFEDFVTVEPQSSDLGENERTILDERLLEYAQHPENVIEWAVFRAQLDQQE